MVPRHRRARVHRGRLLRKLGLLESALAELLLAFPGYRNHEQTLAFCKRPASPPDGSATSCPGTAQVTERGYADEDSEMVSRISAVLARCDGAGRSSRWQARHYQEIGYVLARRGLPSLARQAVEKAVACDPGKYQIRIHLARLVRQVGDYTRASQLVDEAVYGGAGTPSDLALRDIVAGDLAVFTRGTRPCLPRVTDYRPRPQRVLHVLENSLPHRMSGYTLRTHCILRHQRAGDLRVAGVTRPGYPWDHGIERPDSSDIVDGVEYHRIPIDGRPQYDRHPLDAYLQVSANGVLTVAQSVRPELLHAASNFKNGFAAAAVAQALGIPWVYEVRGLWEDTQVSRGLTTEDSERYRFFRESETECLRKADAVVTICESLKSEIESRGIDPDRVVVVPNAVDGSQFSVMPRDPALARTLLLGEGPVFGYVGSLAAYEGLDLLVHAFPSVLREIPAARLLIVGDGEQRTHLAGLVERLGIGGSVTLTGSISHHEISRYYSIIDVFALPRLPWRVCQLVTPRRSEALRSDGDWARARGE